MIYRLTIDCFHLTAEAEQALQQFRQDRLLGKSRIALRPGGLAAAVEHYRDNASPPLVIVEDDGDEATVLERLGHLAEVCVSGTRVLVIGHVNDIGVYRSLLSRGVSDYFVAPVTAAQLMGAVEALFSDRASAPRGRMVAFFGARGGVGSSTLAHNVAWVMAETTGEEVILLDLDLAFGTAGLAFNLEARQTVGELLGEPDRIDVQLLDRILVKYDERLKLLPSPSELRSWPPIEVEAVDKLFDLIRQLAPLVVVDLPHLWAPWVVHALEQADELVIVAQPDLPNLRDVKALLDGVGQRRGEHAPTHLVLNKQDAYKKTQLSAKDFEETLKVRPVISLPFDPIFGEVSNNGQMLGEAVKNHKLAEAIRQLALLVCRRTPAAAGRRVPAGEMLTAWLKKAKLVK